MPGRPSDGSWPELVSEISWPVQVIVADEAMVSRLVELAKDQSRGRMGGLLGMEDHPLVGVIRFSKVPNGEKEKLFRGDKLQARAEEIVQQARLAGAQVGSVVYVMMFIGVESLKASVRSVSTLISSVGDAPRADPSYSSLVHFHFEDQYTI